jgi:hypothetical protein
LRHGQGGERSKDEKVPQLVRASLRFEAFMGLFKITTGASQFPQQRLICR